MNAHNSCAPINIDVRNYLFTSYIINYYRKLIGAHEGMLE